MADFLTSLLGGRPERKSADWMDRAWEIMLGGVRSKSGPTITYNTALRVSVALACCRVLAEGIAQIPFKLMQELEDGTKYPARKHPLYRVLSRAPNDWMTSFEFRETMMYHALLAKGGFAVINRGSSGRIIELLPVMPERVRIEQAPDMTVLYWIQMSNNAEVSFDKSQIFHLRGPSWDGVQGMEIIDLAREALGLAIATEETHAKFHRNGAKAAGVIGMDGALTPEGRERLKKAFQEASTGENAYKTLVLDQGAKFTNMTPTGMDSQHLETRRFQIEEICRAFRVYPQKVGHSGNASTYAATQRFSIDHVIDSLTPWVRRFEEATDRDLLPESDLVAGYFSKLDIRGLMIGDSTERAEYYTSLYNIGSLNPNEIRALEDRNPYEGGDKYRVPLNMTDPNAPPASVNPAKPVVP